MMHQRGLSIQEAIDEAGSIAKRAIGDFDALSQLEWPPWGEDIKQRVDTLLNTLKRGIVACTRLQCVLKLAIFLTTLIQTTSTV